MLELTLQAPLETLFIKPSGNRSASAFLATAKLYSAVLRTVLRTVNRLPSPRPQGLFIFYSRFLGLFRASPFADLSSCAGNIAGRVTYYSRPRAPFLPYKEQSSVGIRSPPPLWNVPHNDFVTCFLRNPIPRYFPVRWETRITLRAQYWSCVQLWTQNDKMPSFIDRSYSSLHDAQA